MWLLDGSTEVSVTRERVAWVDADGTPLPVEASGSVRLPGGARGYAAARAGGRHDLLLVLPPGVATRVGAEPPSRGVAIVVAPAEFVLDTPEGRHRCHYAEAPRRQTAAAVGVTRCGICRQVLAHDAAALRCTACGVVSCSLCAEAAQCTRCGEVLDGSDG